MPDYIAKKNAIAANVEVLGDLLKSAYETVAHADAAIRLGDRNQAIGALVGLDSKLEDALALYRASIAIHRSRRA
jgi:hypothetical protein